MMKERMTAIIKKQLGANMGVLFQKIKKENGIVLDGVSIYDENDKDSVKIAPIIYYDADEVTEKNVERITREICTRYLANKDSADIMAAFKDTMDSKEKLLSLVVPRVVNYKKNIEMINENNYIVKEYLDLAILFCVNMKTQDGYASFKIRYDMLDRLNLSVKELMVAAFYNLRKNMEIKPLRNAILDMARNELGLDCFKMDDEMFNEIFGLDDETSDILVYSTEGKYYGSAVILLTDIFKEKCYVLPSSVHELIAIPASMARGDNVSVSELKSMVCSINHSEVSVADRLSDNVYYFNGDFFEIM